MRNGVLPAPRALIAFSVPLAVSALAFVWPPALWVALAADGAALLVLLCDLLVSPWYGRRPRIEVRLPATMVINRFNEFLVRVVNDTRLPVRFRLLLDCDESFDRAYSRVEISAGPGETREEVVRLFARRRGVFPVRRFFIKGRSVLGLLNFFRRHALQAEVLVPPFIRPVNEVFRMVQKNIEVREGAQKSAFLGEGRDFEMLKAYAKGDDFNKIDWKATARLRTPVTRVYRLENTLEVALVVDCGRIMATEVDGMSLLDYAADAALVLSYAAVRNYDSVSLTCFGGDVRQHVPPIKHKRDLQRLSLALTMAEYEQREPDFGSALGFVARTLSKRSLVIVLTDLVDDSNCRVLESAFSVLRRRHLVLLTLIRDKRLFAAGESRIDRLLSIHVKAAAADLIMRRAKSIASLRRLGIDVLDVYPEQVTASLVNHYLDLKSRN